MNTDILVPLSFIVVLFLTVKLLLDYRLRSQQQLQLTLRAALQSGAALPHDVLRRLGDAIDPRRADLRRAIVFAVLAAVVAMLGWLLPLADGDGRQAMLAIAVVPLALSLTHLGFWKFWHLRE